MIPLALTADPPTLDIAAAAGWYSAVAGLLTGLALLRYAPA